MAGSAWALSHAINKHTKHDAINLLSMDGGFAGYPTFAMVQDYSPQTIRHLTEKADVIIFHSAAKAYYQGFNLSPQALEGKQKFLYFHGSDARFLGKELTAEADECMDNYTPLVSTPDLLILDTLKNPKWLPVTRSFTEIQQTTGTPPRDQEALAAFATPQDKTVFCHAPSDEWKKGSQTFYTAMTRLLREMPNVAFTQIRHQPWLNCLHLISQSHVYLDQDPPFAGSYGITSVEAAIFSLPCVCRMQRAVIDLIKRETGLSSPFITFRDEDELMARLYLLAEDRELRAEFGRKTREFCMKVHDEKPVVDKFMEMIQA